VAGVAYWALVFALTPASFHGAPAYVGLVLPRTLVWFALIWPYLSAQQRGGLAWTLPLLGSLLSYALDFVTSALVHVLPGMTMPWC